MQYDDFDNTVFETFKSNLEYQKRTKEAYLKDIEEYKKTYKEILETFLKDTGLNLIDFSFKIFNKRASAYNYKWEIEYYEPNNFGRISFNLSSKSKFRYTIKYWLNRISQNGSIRYIDLYKYPQTLFYTEKQIERIKNIQETQDILSRLKTMFHEDIMPELVDMLAADTEKTHQEAKKFSS